MEFRKKIPNVLFLFFLIILILNILIIVSPVILPYNTVHNLDGYAGSIENNFEDMPSPINFVYLSGDFICHQKEDRSFELNGNQMPLCSRCVAIAVGLVIGMVIVLFVRVVPDLGFLMLFGISLVPIALDGLGQLFSLWNSTNLTRVMTGLPPGIMSGIAIGIVYDEYILWRDKNGRKPQFKRQEEINRPPAGKSDKDS